MPTEPFSFVLEFPAASPQDARPHFLSKLAVETDVSDVATDLERKRGGFVVVDVRNQKAYAERHVPGAINLPWRTIDERIAARFEGKLVVVYCWGPGCNGATKGAARLAGLGVQVKEMIGGLEYWLREGHDTEGTVPRTVPLQLE
jgi:rhodanese-related sulfurtransferase